MKAANEFDNFLKIKSDIIEKDVDSGFQVWTHKSPNTKMYPDLVFFRCEVLNINGDVYKLKEISPDTGSIYEVKKQFIFNCNNAVDIRSHRLNDMVHQNAAEVLNTLALRYDYNYIYTIVEPMLISVNPYQVIDVDINEYKNPTNTNVEPHVYMYARDAMYDFINTHHNQSIIISGESGSGKTEASKLVIKYYLSEVKEDNSISKTLWDSNIILEAFGNAKTIKNNNSSRYGKYIKIEIDNNKNIIASGVEIFLLEKIRVVTQEADERSYHIFYFMLKGMDSYMKGKYKIRSDNEYKYLSNGYLAVDEIDDAREFSQLLNSFNKIQMDALLDDLFFTLSGILLLGNIEFDGVEKSGRANCSELKDSSDRNVKETCELLGIEEMKFRRNLIISDKVIANQNIEIPLTVEESLSACRSIAKDIYNRLFEFLSKRINFFLNENRELESYIGILDIFGFEIFLKNSLEQLLINIANEEIHNIYLFVVYEKETTLYRDEGISTGNVTYTNNNDIIDLLRGQTSIISILEDTCLAPGKKDEALVGIYSQKFKTNSHYDMCKKDISGSFVIRHTVSDVPYTVANFISKNKDILSPEFLELLQNSQNQLIQQIYSEVELTKTVGRKHLITFKYLENLKKICSYLKSTNVFFIKCIKPNETKQKNDFNHKKVFPQLFSLSIVETLNIKFFFQYKYTFASFLNYFQYLNINIANDNNLDDKSKVTRMLQENFDDEMYKIGKTMVFLKKEVLHQIRELIEQNLKSYKTLCNMVGAVVMKVKKKNAVIENMQKLRIAQAHFRKFKYMKEHQ